ncbi:uncharacterized protein CIMG_07636 [Coccidioides immitis RS]|uniref:Uncharacterized protein n=1 Tax=Coccidioides immitis (strain RS) TaxID=246410 RepID=J3K3T7_COCIM|nr:uncharacterized protein CIMG_07636 [Coccidioides immitis RS]EAS28890.3 hypothetical protein CIMG_07636 [Coccidioides immitis RS]
MSAYGTAGLGVSRMPQYGTLRSTFTTLRSFSAVHVRISSLLTLIFDDISALGGVSKAQTISRRAGVKIKQWAGNPGFTIKQYPTDESSPTVPTPNVCSTPIRPGQRRERSAIEHMSVRVLKNLRSMKSIATPYILRILRTRVTVPGTLRTAPVDLVYTCYLY